MKMKQKFEEEVKRFRRFQRGVLGIKGGTKIASEVKTEFDILNGIEKRLNDIEKELKTFREEIKKHIVLPS